MKTGIQLSKDTADFEKSVRKACKIGKKDGQRGFDVLIEPRRDTDVESAKNLVTKLREDKDTPTANLGLQLNLAATSDEKGNTWKSLKTLKTVAIETYRFRDGGQREANRDYRDICKSVCADPMKFPGLFDGYIIFRFLGADSPSQEILNSLNLFGTFTK